MVISLLAVTRLSLVSVMIPLLASLLVEVPAMAAMQVKFFLSSDLLIWEIFFLTCNWYRHASFHAHGADS